MRIILAAVDESLANAWERFCGDLDFVEVHRGSILEVACDAFVSPANSFGFMDGGIDAAYRRFFGNQIQQSVQDLIHSRHGGELVVGTSDFVETGHATTPYLILAPTMRVPMVLNESVNAYLAARAVFRLMREFPTKLNQVALPGLGTGVGQLSSSTCAHQVRAAMDAVLLNRIPPPRSWAEASERHQLLYTDRPRRLQV